MKKQIPAGYSLALIPLLAFSLILRAQASEPSSQDLWDTSQGTVITGSSPIRGGFDARDMFGGQFSSQEPGHLVFADNQPAGTVHYIEWQTPAPVLLGSFALFAAGDGEAFRNQREFDRFTLRAKSPGSAEFDRVLFTFTPAHPYTLQEEENVLLIRADVTPILAQEFRAEFIQFTSGRNFDGPRVSELDAFPPGPSSGPSHEDLWDISQGTVVTGASGMRMGFNERDMFGGEFSSVEPGNTVFADGRPPGFVHFIEWQTPAPVFLGSFALFAAGDSETFLNQREFDQFTLLTKSPNSEQFDVVLFSFSPAHPYTLQDAENLLLLRAVVTPVLAREFRAEFVQFTAGRGFDGPRVIELDGFPPHCTTPAPSGLVGWWRAEGNAADAAGQNDGEFIGAAGFEEGHVGQAFQLDGKTNRVEVPASQSLRVSSLTLEAWVKPEDTRVQQPVLEYAGATGSVGVHLWLSVTPGGSFSSPGTLFANLRDESGGNHIVVSEAGRVAPGVWSHVALTYDPGTGLGRLYVNGLKVAEEALGTFTPRTAVPFHIGYRPELSSDGGAGNRFTGGIDEVTVYNRALEPGEIAAIYEAGQDGKCLQVTDVTPPVLTIDSPASGTTSVEQFQLAGTVTDNVGVAGLRWEWNGQDMGELTVTADAYAGEELRLVQGANHIRVTALDAAGNESEAEVVVLWVPARMLRVAELEPRQEGQRLRVPLLFSSPGDVGGMAFVLRFDPEVLAEPEVNWRGTAALGFTEVTVDRRGELEAMFALSGTALPAGGQVVAEIVFRARSVPHTLQTPLGLEVREVADAAGDAILSGVGAEGGLATVLVRRLKGDNNANHRLDIGDATLIQRLIAGPAFVRPWDVTSNDLSPDNMLDSADVIRLLRAAVGIDPQPVPQGSETGPRGLHSTRENPEEAPSLAQGNVTLALSASRAAPGESITVQIGLAGLNVPVAAIALQVEYPVEALRLKNEPGGLVPAGAISIWNLAPAQAAFSLQSGRLTLAVSHSTPWLGSGGVLADLEFEVQPRQTARTQWPIRISAVELTSDGFELLTLPESTAHFIGRDPAPPVIEPGSIGLTEDGFALTVTGEAGVTYLLEASIDLIDWFPALAFQGTGVPVRVQDPGTAGESHRFYRVRFE